MKITLEPTNTEKFMPYSTVSISIPGDDWNINEVGDLMRGVLLAWGFSHENVDELIAPR